MEQGKLIIQKIPGYEDRFMVIGGPEPQIVTKQKVVKNIQALKGELSLQIQMVQKMDQVTQMDKASKEPKTNKVQAPPQVKNAIINGVLQRSNDKNQSKNAKFQKEIIQKKEEA